MSTNVELNSVGNYANGVLSDAVAVVATQPLDTVKTWILAGKRIPSLTKLPGSGLYNGTFANCSGAVVQGGFPFLVNGLLMDFAKERGALSDNMRIAVAVSTGVATSALVAPFERVAKMHQLFGGTAANAFWNSIKKGSGGLFKAIGPVAARDALVSGAFFGGRSVVENQLGGIVHDQKAKEGVASVIMGIVAGAFSTPADRINVLMQGDVTNTYPSMAKTAKMIIRQEGLKGLFRGTLVRSGFLGAYMVVLGYAERNFRNRMPIFFQKQ